MPDHVAALERARQCWNAGDLDGYLSLYDPTIRLHGYSPQPLDKPAVAEFYRNIFASLTAPGAAAPHLEFHAVMTDGDDVCVRFTMSGEQTGEFNGVPPTGAPYALDGITILRFGGERVVERWSVADFLGLMVQLGALPAPA